MHKSKERAQTMCLLAKDFSRKYIVSAVSVGKYLKESSDATIPFNLDKSLSATDRAA
jgi:hypothetical protein